MPNNDLISRKALIEQIEEDAKHMMFTSHHSRMLHDDMVEFAIDAIECAPAVDAEPVRHGKWIENYAYGAWHYDCPFCDDGYATKKREKKPVNFCHNCGAKMEKEE